MVKELVGSKILESVKDKNCLAYQKLVEVMRKLSDDVEFGKIIEVGEGYKYEVEIKEGTLDFSSFEEIKSGLIYIWISIRNGKTYLVTFDEGNQPGIEDW